MKDYVSNEEKKELRRIPDFPQRHWSDLIYKPLIWFCICLTFLMGFYLLTLLAFGE